MNNDMLNEGGEYTHEEGEIKFFEGIKKEET